MLGSLSSVWKTVSSPVVQDFTESMATADPICGTDTACSLQSDMDQDSELVPFLSNKLTECIATWMQANYVALITNYKAIFDAYTELKSNYDQIMEQNEAQKQEIESLKATMKTSSENHKKELFDCQKLIDSNLEELNSYKRSISALNPQPQAPLEHDDISQEELRLDHMTRNNQNEHSQEIQRWKGRVIELEMEMAATKRQWRGSQQVSLQSIQELKSERKGFYQEIRNLKQRNKYLELRLESKEKESDFHAKCVQNATSLKEMEHVHTLQKYQTLTQQHQHNIRAMNSFLNQVTKRCALFLSKYSKTESVEEQESDDGLHGTSDHGQSALMRLKGIDSKLTMTYANLEQFLQDVSMLMLEKENAHLKRIEEDELVMTDSETFGDSMIIAVD